ncbi:hypothetical protein AB0M87_08715 [Streptomyces sp. NPDC051320]|uniref:hypothetical protein n=1 Tax=Streptomyces sp. NPDC051320 TaxID=3154644 RepID=UPI003448D403
MTVSGHAIGLLRAQPVPAELAARSFGFDLDRAGRGEAVRLASGASLDPLAGDGAGGAYFVCGGGPVLYASAAGAAGLIGADPDEALEMLIGLPAWRDLLQLAPGAGERQLLAAVAESEKELRARVPDLDAGRSELRDALGFAERSPVELVARLHTALLRTEPGHVLLDTATGRAHGLLDPHPRTPLRETVLAPGRADLARLRDDASALPAVAEDGARRAAVLRAAQFDRRDTDLPLLRRLLAYEAAAPRAGEELRLAAVLVGLHGCAADVPLLREIGASKPAARRGTPAIPEAPAPLAAWARAADEALFGDDPARQPELTWIRLARRQGRTEHARVALLRMLDGAGTSADVLRILSAELEALGDHFQAARAQSGYAALLDKPRERALAARKLTELQRLTGDLPAAWRTLQQVAGMLDADESGRQWRRLGLGRLITAEHFELALAAARAKLTRIARESLSAGAELQSGMGKSAHRSLGMLSQEAKWAVARLIK